MRLDLDAVKQMTLTLCEVERIAIENNPHLLALAELLCAAKEGSWDSFSKLLPQLSVWNQSYRTQFNQLPLLDSRMSFTTQFTMTQALLHLEKFYQYKISETNVRQACLLELAAYNDVLLTARDAYFQVILDKKNIASAWEKVRLLEQLAGQERGLFDIGQAIVYTVNQAEVFVANAYTVYFEMIRNFKVDKDRLALVLGLDPLCVSIEPADEEIPLQPIALLAEKIHEFHSSSDLFTLKEICCWEKIADERRPDIRLGRNYLWKARENVHLKQSDYYPDLDLIGNYGGEPAPLADYPKPSFFHQSFSWGVGLQLNWLLFDSLGREARVAKARSEEKAFCFNFKQTVEAAHADVREQIFDIEQSVATYVTSRANVRLAEELLEQARTQLNIGYITVYDFKIAIDALIQARNAMDRSSFGLIASYFGLRHATGVDLQ